jgi:hypothetical protein
MKKIFIVLFAFFLIASLSNNAFAACSPGSNWTATWTDAFAQTTYNLVAPCKVYIGTPFTITATVTDSAYPDDDVAFGWAIKDNGTTISGGGFNWLGTINGQWQQVIEQTYTGTPVDHVIEFKFSDLGEGSGAHMWAASLIGDLTVDPYPPAPNTPPVADASPDVFLESKDQGATIIAGTASDQDGDALSFRWLEDTVELQASRQVDASGNASLSLAEVPALSIGSHTFTLEVSDGTSVVTDTVVVSLENSKPMAAPAAGGTFSIGQDIPLAGSVADFDGDTLSYRWLEGTSVLAEGVISVPAGGTPVNLPEQIIPGGLPLGTHTLVLEVCDGIQTVAVSAEVTVIDTAAPTLAPAASTYILWPPTGRMTEVTITANARDDSGGPVMLSVTVSVSQPSLKSKRGKVEPDYSIVSIDQSAGVIVLQLRSSKGNEEERIYSATITAGDASGNSSSSEVRIKAARSGGGKAARRKG